MEEIKKRFSSIFSNVIEVSGSTLIFKGYISFLAMCEKIKIYSPLLERKVPPNPMIIHKDVEYYRESKLLTRVNTDNFIFDYDKNIVSWNIVNPSEVLAEFDEVFGDSNPLVSLALKFREVAFVR